MKGQQLYTCKTNLPEAYFLPGGGLKAGLVKCKKRKENKFLFLLAERKKLLTFALPTSTTGAENKPVKSLPGLKEKALTSLKKRFGSKKINAELWQPKQRENKKAQQALTRIEKRVGRLNREKSLTDKRE